jgi:hypothetical protein
MAAMGSVCNISVWKPEGKTQLDDLGVDGMIILKWILEPGCDDVEWIHLAQGRVR